MNNLDIRLMQTPDLNKERLEKLKSLFPDLFTVEGKLNPDELKKIIDPDLVIWEKRSKAECVYSEQGHAGL